ncbi:phosphatidylglycerol:prolipoprotein diacylglycerol transferase [Parabacteroides sp. PFB2-10]|uniref:prolipoprotein diacylglyceryl transferase n=1 Tax=Parabacteroides sp. PFB2-10 TaxID=1742405 RepID=UPI002473F28E|nr:prolipoprotein diacylglyceryl transferase [Parabacteroides sp. PFB2-10]MDH6311301.1 phosphatidylglycerol:prolipoprotein diacylglycerol transferase [Parabacteroides sp. PFB2-10]
MIESFLINSPLSIINWTTSFITWTASPEIFSIGSRGIRWYGLAFAIGFAVGYMIVARMWKNEKLPQPWIDSLLIYTVVGTIVGSRLGHCLFYAPGYYLANPIEILKVWEGGLASHGGVLGIIIAIYFYSRRVSHKSMLWAFDKLVVPTGLVAAMIRLGNLMNHEIYGHPTDLPWGFRFIDNLPAWMQGAEPIFTAPSHPTQLYEALCYLLTFALCMWLYFRKKAWHKEGLIFGLFMICIFVSRFFIEFLKNNQEAFEENMTLNMGQWLSIPFVLMGIFFVWRALKKGKETEVKTKK